MTAEIHIFGPISMLKGEYPLAAVRKATSYPVEGAHFSKAFRKKMWDGRKHLFKTQTGAFPTGLVSIVKETCETNGVPVSVFDQRQPPKPRGGTFDLVGTSYTYPYEYQLDACQKAIEAKQGIIKIATNGGKTNIAAGITKYLELNTLFLVTTRELLYQARDRFMKSLGVGEGEIGIIGDGHWEPGSWVTIAILDTLASRLDTQPCQDFLKSIEVLFIDECHHTGSETVFEIAVLCPAFYRFGLSGTPLDRTDGANLRLIAATGDIIVNISNKYLVDRGISARAKIIFDKITEPVLKDKITYPSAYKKGVVENSQLLAKTIDWIKALRENNLSVLILVEEIEHGRILDSALWTDTGGVFIPHQFIHGEEDSEVRTNALKDFENRTLPVLIASTILDEGIDVPTIDALICAGSKKSRIRTLQRLGRGLRGKKLIVVEFANFTHDYLLKHSLQRHTDYKTEDCFDMYQSGPDVDLIKKLWQ